MTLLGVWNKEIKIYCIFRILISYAAENKTELDSPKEIPDENTWIKNIVQSKDFLTTNLEKVVLLDNQKKMF